LDTYHVVLYVHLLALLLGMTAGGVLVVCLLQLRAATTLEAAVPWAMVAGTTEKAFPIAVIGLFATGAYMTSDVWTWSTGWIDVSIAGLAILALQGPLVGGRVAKKLEHALTANGPGELGLNARAMTRHPGLWVTECTNLALVCAVVWNMTTKPGTWTAVLALAVAYVVGTAIAMQFTKVSDTELAPVAEPTA
jgi:hypothetical protein